MFLPQISRERIVAIERSNRYSLYALIVFVTLVAMFFGLVRLVAQNPELLSALVPLYCIAVTMTPMFLTRFESVDTRIMLGCIVSPISYLLLAVLFSALCMAYRSFVII